MSFDIFLMCYRKGQPITFEREIFDKIFLPYCNDPKDYASDPSFMQVEYPDGGGADIYIGGLDDDEEIPEAQNVEPTRVRAGELDHRPEIGHMMFNHCGGDMFFESMYKLGDQTQSVIFWPNVPSLVVVTNEAVLKELEPNFPGIDNPRIVRSGADIVEAIRNC